ncbi:MAG: hypothetical protein KME18_25755 [Phormidium tanganyikae FI6-MK23]|jgi:hypothetical protein|nr:hypothetical protein [Phormidium tanganyikae FI6-MK23]
MKTQNSSNEPNWTQPNQTTGTRSMKASNWRYLKWFIYFVCGILIAYSVVPWQAAGNAIGTAIVSLPLVRQLQTVPLLGLLISLIVWILPNLMSVLLWALTQLIEITPVLLHDPEIYNATIKQLRTHEASQPSDHPTVEKFQKKVSHYLIDIFRNIGTYAALAYVTELTVNLWYYLPYGTGWNDFVRDFGVWDASLIKWSDFFLMIGSIAVVEVLVLFMLNVHRFFKAISPRTAKHI